MYKTLAAVGVAAALLFAAPQGASALPGQGTDTKNSAGIEKVGYRSRHRHYKHRHWRRGHGHNHHRVLPKAEGHPHSRQLAYPLEKFYAPAVRRWGFFWTVAIHLPLVSHQACDCISG